MSVETSNATATAGVEASRVRVAGAIKRAASLSGTSFEYLLATAKMESDFNPTAGATTSSAHGLFQFIDQTWLGTMKQAGGSLGYGQYADAISRTSSGRYVVTDPAMRQQIFALRKDPTANSLMAGAFANSNAKVLTERLGRKPTDGELYMAHFLGASGAARFINAAQANPNGKAASFFPRAAQANQSIFYGQNGAKSLRQVYAALAQKHNVMSPTQLAELKSPDSAKSADNRLADNTAPSAGAATTVASVAAPIVPLAFFQDIPAAPANASAPAASSAVAVSAAPAVAAISAATAADPATTTGSTAVAAVPLIAPVTAPARAGGTMFTSLFQGDDGAPLGSVVRELWGARRVAALETPQAVTPTGAASAGQGPGANAPLDLSQFMRASARGGA